MSGRDRPWSETTALFGGRFDPPHLGHLEAVRGLFREPGVGHVRVLPSPTPAHKPAVASASARVELARLCFAGVPEVELDLREVERAAREPSRPTYTFDTLSELRRDRPALAFVLGSDQLESMEASWHRFPDLLGLVDWIVLERKGSLGAPARQTLQRWEATGLARPESAVDWRLRAGTRLRLCPTDAPALSSTSIREAIARTGQPPRDALPEQVSAYLKRHRLYGTRSDN